MLFIVGVAKGKDYLTPVLAGLVASGAVGGGTAVGEQDVSFSEIFDTSVECSEIFDTSVELGLISWCKTSHFEIRLLGQHFANGPDRTGCAVGWIEGVIGD
jgi:hypothetical protein